MNLDQIKKDLEEFKKHYQEGNWIFACETHIEKHLEELICQFELSRIDSKIQTNFSKMNALADKSAADLLRNQLQKAEEVIRFYAENCKVLPIGLTFLGQKAREYFEKGKHNV